MNALIAHRRQEKRQLRMLRDSSSQRTGYCLLRKRGHICVELVRKKIAQRLVDCSANHRPQCRYSASGSWRRRSLEQEMSCIVDATVSRQRERDTSSISSRTASPTASTRSRTTSHLRAGVSTKAKLKHKSLRLSIMLSRSLCHRMPKPAHAAFAIEHSQTTYCNVAVTSQRHASCGQDWSLCMYFHKLT